jgi:hypothetical protein
MDLTHEPRDRLYAVFVTFDVWQEPFGCCPRSKRTGKKVDAENKLNAN